MVWLIRMSKGSTRNRCNEVDKFLLTYVILKLKLVKGKTIIFVNDVDRCYRLKLFLEQFSIKSCVLNSELPLNSYLRVRNNLRHLCKHRTKRFGKHDLPFGFQFGCEPGAMPNN